MDLILRNGSKSKCVWEGLNADEYSYERHKTTVDGVGGCLEASKISLSEELNVDNDDDDILGGNP